MPGYDAAAIFHGQTKSIGVMMVVDISAEYLGGAGSYAGR